VLNWQSIVIHHSLTKDSATVSWDAIRRFHKAKGWREIGYHAGIEKVGKTYEVLLGRPLDWGGSHTKGKNQTSLGFVFIGNYDETDPPSEMLKVAAERVIRPWMKIFNIPANRIFGHRDFASKSCPGRKFHIQQLIDTLNSLPEADK